VQAVCYQDMFFLEILNLEERTNWLSQNVGMEFYSLQSNKRAGLKTCSISVCLSVRRPNGWKEMCSVTLLQKMSRSVNSHDLPGQGIGPSFPTQHLCSRSICSFISKTHLTLHFQLLIPHKQNPHTQINQLAVTAKISSHSGIQLCVASVGDQSRKTDFHGLHESLPCLVPNCLLWTDHTCVWQRQDKYSSSIMTQWTSDPPSKSVSV
jgi:hypothetical protein